MSNTANWSYTNTAKIRPLLGVDKWGAKTYGPEYDIACTWEAVTDQERQGGANGMELLARYTVYTEVATVKPLDMILLNGQTEWQEVRDVLEWDMSFFGETPDYRIMTK